MCGVIRRIFYDFPRDLIYFAKEARHASFLTFMQETRAKHNNQIQKETEILANEINSIEEILDQRFLPALLEYDRQAGALKEEESKYLDGSPDKEINQRMKVHSQVLSNLRQYKRFVRPHLLEDYFSVFAAYERRLDVLADRNEELRLE